jgi:hypothetical protein
MPSQGTWELKAKARFRRGEVYNDNESKIEPIGNRNIFFGIIIIGLHIACIVPEALKLNKTSEPTTKPTTEPTTDPTSEPYIVQQKQDQERKEKKKTYSIIIISISSIMVALISGAIVTNRLHTYLYTERFYWFTFVFGIIALFVNLILFVIKEQYL